MFRLNMDPYGSVPTKRPDDGSRAETCRLECVFNNKLDVSGWKKICTLYNLQSQLNAKTRLALSGETCPLCCKEL